MEKFLNKILTAPALIAVNVVVILLAELSGGGTFFAETGLIHGVAFLFVALIMLRIFSDFAFTDPQLRGFLDVQLTFLVFLALVHVYEYLGEHIFMLREDVVQLTVVASYFTWFIAIFLSVGVISRNYYQGSALFVRIPWIFFGICILGLIAPNVSDAVVAWFPSWFPKLILAGIVAFALIGTAVLLKLRSLMPIFHDFSLYMIPASFLVVIASFFEYFESGEMLARFGIDQVQNLYLSHFTFYAGLSLLLIAYGKLKRPGGIYQEM